MKQTMTIDGRTFTFKRFEKHDACGWDIWDVYDRPSRTKENIWRGWVEWANRNGFDLKITSANTSTFTIEAWDDAYYMRITKDHNYIMYN